MTKSDLERGIDFGQFECLKAMFDAASKSAQILFLEYLEEKLRTELLEKLA